MEKRRIGVILITSGLVATGLLGGFLARSAVHHHRFGFDTHMAVWDPPEHVEGRVYTPAAMHEIDELNNVLARKRRLNAEDIDRLFYFVERPWPELTPEIMNTPPAESIESREIMGLIRTRSDAEMILEERLREDVSLDDATKQRIIAHILAKLESPDPNVRIEGMAAIISTELVREPEYRARVEVMRGDPDRSVAETAARKLHHWDRAN